MFISKPYSKSCFSSPLSSYYSSFSDMNLSTGKIDLTIIVKAIANDTSKKKPQIMTSSVWRWISIFLQCCSGQMAKVICIRSTIFARMTSSAHIQCHNHTPIKSIQLTHVFHYISICIPFHQCVWCLSGLRLSHVVLVVWHAINSCVGAGIELMPLSLQWWLFIIARCTVCISVVLSINRCKV